MSVPSTFIMGLEASYMLDLGPRSPLKSMKLSGNITNLTDTKGVSTAVVTSTSGGYQAYPIAPRMFFVTLEGMF